MFVGLLLCGCGSNGGAGKAGKHQAWLDSVLRGDSVSVGRRVSSGDDGLRCESGGDGVDERQKRMDPAWYRTEEGAQARLEAKTGHYVYPEKLWVTCKGLDYAFGVGMNEVDVIWKMGDPEEIVRSSSGSEGVVIYFYDHNTICFHFVEGKLKRVTQLGKG